MFRKLWTKISGARSDDQELDASGSENAVVPLRKDKRGRDITENLVVTKKDHVERLSDMVNQLVEKLEGIHTHLGSHVSQNEQLLEHIRKLPDMLNNVPESMKRQETAVQSLTEELRRKAQADAQLTEKIATLPEETARQTQALEEIGKQIFASSQTEEAMSENFATLAQSVSQLGDNTTNQTEWIQKMSRSFAETDRYLKDSLVRQQKRMLWIYFATVGVSLAAIAGLVVAVLILRGTL